MEHLPEHPHAFLKDGIVINVASFDSHDSELLELVKIANEADTIICCCDYGNAYIGGTFDAGRFYPQKPHSNWIWSDRIIDISERAKEIMINAGIFVPEPYTEGWIPPVPKPTDGEYEWIQDENRWNLIELFEE